MLRYFASYCCAKPGNNDFDWIVHKIVIDRSSLQMQNSILRMEANKYWADFYTTISYWLDIYRPKLDTKKISHNW